MKTTKTTMYVYPLRDKVIPFKLTKALVDISYDKWNESIMIEDYQEKTFSVSDVEQLQKAVREVCSIAISEGMLDNEDLDGVFNNFKGK